MNIVVVSGIQDCHKLPFDIVSSKIFSGNIANDNLSTVNCIED